MFKAATVLQSPGGTVNNERFMSKLSQHLCSNSANSSFSLKVSE
jgi:hypothetical protein